MEFLHGGVSFPLFVVRSMSLVHTTLRDDYDCYGLSDGEIHEIQDLVFSKKYTISPMRVVSKSQSNNDFCELEGQLYPLPYVNDDHIILTRFPVDFLFQELPLYYHSPDLLSSNFRYSEKRTHYITSSPSDIVVISAFIMTLIKSLTEDQTFFRKSCYNQYQTEEEYNQFLEAILQWKDIKHVFFMNCENSKSLFSRERVIEKIAPLVNSDKYLMTIIRSIVNIPILDQAGTDHSSKTGSPMIPILDEILFNIFLDDIDQKIEVQYPQLNYARYQHLMLIHIDKSHTQKSMKETLSNILPENLFSPSLGKIYSPGDTFPLIYSQITIHQDGSCVNKIY